MKKTFISGLLLLAVAASGTVAFTSCKDTDDDNYTTLNGKVVNLQDLLSKLQTQVNDCCKDHNHAGWDAAAAQINAIINNLKDNGNIDLSDPQTARDLAALIGMCDNLKDAFGPQASQPYQQLWNQVFGGDGVEGLVQYITDEDGTPYTAAEFRNLVAQGAWVIENKTEIENILSTFFTEDGEETETYKNLKDYGDSLDEMYNTLFGGEDATEPDAKWYTDAIDRIAANEAAIEALKEEVEKILENFNTFVTGIELNASHNPVFGAFNTPFGLNSMVAMTYFGTNATGIQEFPQNDMPTEYNGGDAPAAIGEIDWSKMGTPVAVEDLLVKENEEGEAVLGDLWFTVNPGTADITKGELALVNSKDETSPVKLTAAKDNETVLKFGITSRADDAATNGLYHATATVAKDELANIKINVEPDLKSAVADVVRDRNLSAIIADGGTLLKAVYRQLNNVCDANAIRYTWKSYNGTEGEGENATAVEKENKVYSNYGIAATAIKPLSFAAFYGKGIRNLPIINPITIPDDFLDINFGDGFNLDGVKVNFHFQIESDIEIGSAGDVKVDVKVPAKYDVNPEGTEATLPDDWENTPGYYDVQEIWINGNGETQLDDAIKAATDPLLNFIQGSTDDPESLSHQINEKINEQLRSILGVDENGNVIEGSDGLVANITKQVNDMMGEIEDSLEGIVEKINKDYLGKVNSLLDRYNSLAERINKVLSNPNHYLQAMMAYRGADGGLHILSQNPNQPSQFKGDGQAIAMWVTTYSLETLAPVYKKFVGVSKVTDKNGNEVASVPGNCNGKGDFGKVLDGDRNRVALNVADVPAGEVYTYELCYQALDFSGVTSTIKCYVQVDKR